MQTSEIIHHKSGGTTLAGPDAVNLFRAATLASGLKLYGNTGMKLTRHVSGPDMLRMAKEYTGKVYKRGEYLKAAEDVRVWVAEMRAALPHSES